MKPTKKTRMPVDKLIPAHFEVFPIWEYVSDEEGVEGMDETWVRPVCSKAIPSDGYSQSVSATFTTSKGGQYLGFMTISPACSTKKRLDHNGGVLFHKEMRCDMIDLNGPAIDFMKKECVKDLERALNLPEEEIYPLGFVLNALIEGESSPRKGVLEARRKSKAKKR